MDVFETGTSASRLSEPPLIFTRSVSAMAATVPEVSRPLPVLFERNTGDIAAAFPLLAPKRSASRDSSSVSVTRL